MLRAAYLFAGSMLIVFGAIDGVIAVRGKPARVHEALPAIHYYCSTCNIEWDTGLKERHAEHDPLSGS